MRALADATQVQQLIQQMGGWVDSLRSEYPDRDFAIVGVRSRGDLIGQRVAEQLGIGGEGPAGRVGVLDITLYRDDLSEASSQPVVRTTEIDFSIDGLDVVLIDDVLMSGRSVRSALSSLMDMGRPRRVWLAVLVDRGSAMRELPIAADFVGITHEGEQRVSVRLMPMDDRDAIELE